MKLFKLTWAACAVALLASCSNNDNKEVDNPEGPQGSGEMEVMSPEESKNFLQNSVTEFLGKFNPEDQKEAIVLAGHFAREYEDFDVPAEFDIEPDAARRMPGTYLKALAKAARGDVNALADAGTSYNYTINFDRFAGVYEPDSGKKKWVRKEDSKDIVFKFYNQYSQPVELKITQSGGTSEVDFTLTDWDYNYDYENDKYEEWEDKYNYFLSIPKTVTVTLTNNGKQLANSTVVSSIDMDGHTLSADVKATLMNLRAEAIVSGNDSKVEARTNLFVSDEKIATVYATLNGHDLLNRKKYESFEDMDDDEIMKELGKMFKDGDAGVDVLGKIQVYAQATFDETLFKNLSAYYDDDEYDSKEEARKACQDACNHLAKNIKTQLRYNNTVTNQATVSFAPYLYESSYGSWWEYEIIGQLYFYQDQTTYDIDSYFENFTRVTSKWESLVKAYENMWNLGYGTIGSRR